MPSGRLSYFAVIRERCPPWDWTRPMEAQELWPEHARFMEELVSSGFVVLGGPLGEYDHDQRVLLVIDADGPEAVRSRLAADPWSANGLLRTASIESWSIRLDGRGSAGHDGGSHA